MTGPACSNKRAVGTTSDLGVKLKKTFIYIYAFNIRAYIDITYIRHISFICIIYTEKRSIPS